ncbi:MAG: tetratricopeptide repeat protein [Bryobacterales bacterium]|nr:tetratricopeptide repeat protein [Bryobacterales bacterium]
MNVGSWWVFVCGSGAILLGAVPPCRLCHPDKARGFAQTGMGRSISVPGTDISGAYYHRGSNRHYRVANGTLRRHQIDAQGREVNIEEKAIDLFLGSGNHAKTLVHRSSDGRLLELPLTWYASDKGGYWAMSPGYDRPDHLDFRREITAECVFCHSASPTPTPIDCSRCHGSTAAHLEKPGKGSILNPANLDPARQVEICLQCHLETASSGLTDSIRRINRDVFSFRPGEPLGGYKLYFDRAAPSPDMDINHAGYGFLQSPCYRKSEGRLTCTTCHNPHRRGVDHRASCRGCHHTTHAQEATDCVSCHMPRRRTRDAIHVVMTDHRVTRHPPLGDPLALRREPTERYSGPLVRFYPPGPASPEDALYLASAQVREDNNLIEGIEMLRRAIRTLKPRDSVWYWDLAEASRRGGDMAGAQRAYRDALSRGPDSAKILTGLADLLLRQDNSEEAEKLLRRAIKADPRFPAALNTLAIIRGSKGRIEEALRLLKASAQARKDLPATWINLGVAYEHAGDRQAAEESYREAIRLQPDSSEARRRLSALH